MQRYINGTGTTLRRTGGCGPGRKDPLFEDISFIQENPPRHPVRLSLLPSYAYMQVPHRSNVYINIATLADDRSTL